jgi:hypothetical protein
MFLCHIMLCTSISVTSWCVQTFLYILLCTRHIYNIMVCTRHICNFVVCTVISVTWSFLWSLSLRWDIGFIPAIEGCGGVPPIRPLETLHNALSLRQLDSFLDIMTSAPLFRTPASSPPKNPSTPVPSTASMPAPPLQLQSPSGSKYSCTLMCESSMHFKLLPLTGANCCP